MRSAPIPLPSRMNSATFAATLAFVIAGCGSGATPPAAEASKTAVEPAKTAKTTKSVKTGSKKLVIPEEDTSFHLRKKKK